MFRSSRSCSSWRFSRGSPHTAPFRMINGWRLASRDRKSTRLNSSHDQISYAVFCLKKKKKTNKSRIHHKSKRTKYTHGHRNNYVIYARTNKVTSAISSSANHIKHQV